jgi:hypothetical protein
MAVSLLRRGLPVEDAQGAGGPDLLFRTRARCWQLGIAPFGGAVGVGIVLNETFRAGEADGTVMGMLEADAHVRFLKPASSAVFSSLFQGDPGDRRGSIDACEGVCGGDPLLVLGSVTVDRRSVASASTRLVYFCDKVSPKRSTVT